MTYPEALDYINGLSKFGINMGLQRIKKILNLMGNPEKKFNSVHITGTNGKGSTTAMLASILKASNLKVGKYTSPHLSQYNERITINEEMISKFEFAKIIDYTAQFIKKMLNDGWENPTEFEVLTAAAFYYFAYSKVDYAVIEVGMGGLLDSTNVIIPRVTIITNVTLDHMDRCGNTITKIAKHKIGIIKKKVPVFTAARNKALNIIIMHARKLNAKLSIYGLDFYAIDKGVSNYKQNIAIKLPISDAPLNVTINLIGKHQIENAAVAAMAALEISKYNSKICEATIINGLNETKWPGRFEIIEGQNITIIDGAHNADGVNRLRKTLNNVFPKKNIIFVLSIMKDKDIKKIIDILINTNDIVIVVQPLLERAAFLKTIVGFIKSNIVKTAKSVETGIIIAKELAKPGDIICVAGSLYLLGAARRFFNLCE